MNSKKRKVVCINADISFLNRKKKELRQKNLENYFYPFDKYDDAIDFVENQIDKNAKRVHYILLDEKILGHQLANSLDKLSGLSYYFDKLEVIVITNNNTNDLRNKIMQYPFVSAFLVKPIPENYIEFLISGIN